MYRLRELERKDINTINCWRNDPDLIVNLAAPFRFINVDVDIEWFENYMKNRANIVRCAIVRRDDDEILGMITLFDIDFLNQSAELHIMIGSKNEQNCGVGTFAIRKMLDHAFFNLNLQRIELSVLAENKRAQHVYEKCGFQREGMKRKSNYKCGRFHDMYIYAILRNEYKGMKLNPSTSIRGGQTYLRYRRKACLIA